MKIKVGILGYGNLGKGIESEIKKCADMELVAIFTRRNPKSIKVNSNTKIVSIDEVEEWVDKIDVMVLCGGSATDLPVHTPKYAKLFNVIDSFDTHVKISEHFKNVDEIAIKNNKVALISCGWDPGTFSLNRLMSECFLPNGNTYTFWGRGVSQGHSDAIRRIPGVKNAVQYTIPKEDAVARVRNSENPILTVKDKHLRDCYVVLEENVNEKDIEEKIKTMPSYFAEYDTEVHFINEEELLKEHSRMPHSGFVIRSGKTGLNDNNDQIIEYSLNLGSNPEFTASVVLAYTRAVYRLSKQGENGAKTIFDIAPSLLSPKTQEEIIKEYL